MGNDLVAGTVATTNICSDMPQQELVAMRPEDMQVAQQSLVQWFKVKVDLVRREREDADENYRIAQQSNFKASSFRRSLDAAQRRVLFYEKCLAAVEAGYAIVPNFPVDVFAIRVTRKHPRWRSMTSQWSDSPLSEEKAELAAAGTGRYVNPQPLQRISVLPKKKLSDGREISQYQHTVDGFCDELDFPVSIAQPAVMEAIRAAMVLNVFDEIGCLPARKKPDPIVVGRIYRPNDKQRINPLCFLIAWWIDTRTL